ncbi:glycosyltransferase family 2 protein [Rhodoferax sp. AJA081-3]|uniref:glycosyltransferase family 2 protein n=1 Tax=Rhodoferax sp. AJA081-3 TaxID=2752316 RepID=UPI001ADEE9D7|nr:glycosyltransferase family 2 protein [Rhodoferax sp. AJA081-3]QTN26856.1 glycosyltransferase family 2 protein [Rhodoferax sp. AJA081-3]
MNIISSIYRRLYELYLDLFCKYSFAHEFGPVPATISNKEFFVVTMIKNDEIFIKPFVEYYTKLGASHIFFIDNGSTDSSVSIVKKYQNVSVYKNRMHFAKHQCRIRRTFLKRYLWGSWVLFVDSDEHFYPAGPGTSSMNSILAHLNQHGYTALAACMIDVLPRRVKEGDSRKLADFCLYQKNSIEITPYPIGEYYCRGNVVPIGVNLYSGGIRKIINPEGEYYLIKHPLMFLGGQIVPFTHPHFCANAKLAEFVLPLLHYKFFGDIAAKIHDAILSGERSKTWLVENEYFSKNSIQAHVDVVSDVVPVDVGEIYDYLNRSS